MVFHSRLPGGIPKGQRWMLPGKWPRHEEKVPYGLSFISLPLEVAVKCRLRTMGQKEKAPFVEGLSLIGRSKAIVFYFSSARHFR